MKRLGAELYIEPPLHAPCLHGAARTQKIGYAQTSAAVREMGILGAPRSPRQGPSRWPAGRSGRGAGAAGRVKASSGGVLASFSVRNVVVYAL